MRSFTFDALPGRVVFGDGAFDRIPDEIERLGAGRVLLITEPSARGWAERLTAASAMGDRIGATIDEVSAHVPIERAEAARDLARRSGADAIVTIGGGSATGLAKAVALEAPIPILAVPTTYAGSEMTPIWGLTSGGRKQTGRDLRVQPRTVVYDPRLTLSLPLAIAGPSGMNALAHCAEALYADGANPITSLLALEGIRILADRLPCLRSAPDDTEVRSDLQLGACLGGSSFAAAGSGLHHKVCHVLGGAYDLPHARMHTVVLPHVLAFNAPAVPEAMADMARALGDPDVPGAVFDLAVTLGAPTSLATIGMPADRLDEAARLIVEAVPSNPRPVDERSVRGLLADAFEGERASLGRSAARASDEVGAVAPWS